MCISSKKSSKSLTQQIKFGSNLIMFYKKAPEQRTYCYLNTL